MSLVKESLSFQKKLTAITAILFLIKIVAWAFTHSVAILTDTLEYTINVVAGFISLYSLYLSAQPKDENHPYGHGKAEFVSAAFEGIMMVVSCFVIVYEAVNNLFFRPHSFHKLDYGIYLVAFTAVINFIAGYYAIRKGKQNNTLTLVATGKHMQSDTYGTLGIIAGLVILYFTGYAWIDSFISIVFAVLIFIAGYKVLRSSIAGIMDEADKELLDEVVKYLNEHRRANWMDIHNLRIIKYGSILHLDCHATIPWYFNINEGHEEVKALEDMIRENFGEHVELFVHTDGCLPISCAICVKQDCTVRQEPFVRQVAWDVRNVSNNGKHMVTTEN